MTASLQSPQQAIDGIFKRFGPNSAEAAAWEAYQGQGNGQKPEGEAQAKK
ncbi:hypothetical protein NDI52_28525 [Leptolyngbya sp. PL-A3]